MKVPEFKLAESFLLNKGSLVKFPIYSSSTDKEYIEGKCHYVRTIAFSTYRVGTTDYCLEKVTIFSGGKILAQNMIIAADHCYFWKDGVYYDIEAFYPLFEAISKTLPTIGIIKH